MDKEEEGELAIGHTEGRGGGEGTCKTHEEGRCGCTEEEEGRGEG